MVKLNSWFSRCGLGNASDSSDSEERSGIRAGREGSLDWRGGQVALEAGLECDWASSRT